MIATPAQSMPEPADWITVDEAARLTGLSRRSWRSRAVNEAQQAKRNGVRPLARKAANPSGVGRSTWWVHRSLHVKLTRFPDRDCRLEWTRDPLAIQHPQHVVDHANRKARWLWEWRRLCETRRDVSERDLAERIVGQASAVEDRLAISHRTLQTWHRAYHRLGPDRRILGVAGLIDRRGACTDSDESAGRSPEGQCTKELPVRRGFLVQTGRGTGFPPARE